MDENHIFQILRHICFEWKSNDLTFCKIKNYHLTLLISYYWERANIGYLLNCDAFKPHWISDMGFPNSKLLF